MADPIDTQRLVSNAIRKAARQLLEDAKAIPAPCGCSPLGTCDRHAFPYSTSWPPSANVGDRVVFRLPDGSMSRHVVTRVNPDGSFAIEREQETVVG